MKSKILSLVCCFAMTATMFGSFMVAHADETPCFKVITDHADPTNIKAGDTFNVMVVIDGLEGLTKYDSKKNNGVGVSSAQCTVFLPDNEFITSGSETAAANVTPGEWDPVEGGYNMIVAFAGSKGAMIYNQPHVLLTVDYTANKDLTEEQVFKIVQTTDTAVKMVKQSFVSGALDSQTEYSLDLNNMSTVPLSIGAAPAPQPTVVAATAVTSATTGDDEVLDTTSKAAQAYVAEAAIASGDKVTWVAANRTSEIDATIANIDATTKLGLIITGDASTLGAISLKVAAN